MNKFIEKLEELLEWGGTKKDITCLVLGGLSLIISIFDLVPLPFDAAWVAIILCGLPIIMEAIIGLVTAFDIKADVLVSLALIASVLIGEDFAAGEVAFIMQLGALLEDLTVSKAREGIEKLVHLTPQTARVLTVDGEKVVPAEQVKIGDRIRVLPGETVPVDGIILSGQTSINQAVMTGESLPVDKTVGDEVSSGTVNQFGAFEMEATKVGEDSSIQRMIRLVQSADAGKAKIVGLADRWATWIVVIALTAAALTWFFTSEIIRAVTILVVFCPCALVLATPTAIMAAIGNATKHGFLVREGDALERLSKVTKITFDKTGTVGGMDVSGIDPETLMSLYSIVFQDVTLFNNTVMENIRLGRKDATDEEVLAAAKLANVDEFAEKLPEKWNTNIGENGCELSGGERQRISIARAFLKGAPIILLDEATASLDVENETQIQSALSKLIKDKTVLIIAHRMRTVAGADKIVVLSDGKVAETGKPDELYKQGGIYTRMVDLQNIAQGWTIGRKTN